MFKIRVAITLALVLLTLGVSSQELVPKNCLRKTDLTGSPDQGEAFTDENDIVLYADQTQRLFALQYCEQNNFLIGLKWFLNRMSGERFVTNLGFHGVSDIIGTCTGASLPTMNITTGRIYTLNNTDGKPTVAGI